MIVFGNGGFDDLRHPLLARPYFAAGKFCDDGVEELIDRHAGQANQPARWVMILPNLRSPLRADELAWIGRGMLAGWQPFMRC
ncbi:MAG: hypothetical protein H6512_13590 [Acidimicrobiia bacterium]|nr:hypothetical protein [Acidimicrobiia bacterium]